MATEDEVVYVKMAAFEDSVSISATERMVASFNEAQSAVQVELVYYSDATQLNLAFVSGDQIDLINFDGYTMSDELYAGKGYLCDLYAFLDADESVSREDLVAAYLNCAEEDGGLYSMATEFLCRTLVAPAELVGEEPGWTLSEFAAVLETLPEGMAVMSDQTKTTFLQYIIEQTITEFVDLNAGTCQFECQAFYDLLTMCDKYFPDTEAQAASGTIAEGTAFLETTFSLFGIQGLVDSLAAFNTSCPVTAMGYPSVGGSGAVLYWYNTYGITTTSQVQEAAWSFIRFAISDSWQSQVYSAIPVSQAKLDEKVEALRAEETTDQAALEQALDLLNNAGARTIYQSALVDIVTEEAETFFAQDQTVEHVADVIQDRAETYLGEIS